MAEAHQAVAFSVKVSDDGIDWNLNLNVLKEIGKSGLKSWYKGIYRIKNRFYNGLYPSKPGNWMFIAGGVFASSVFGFDLSFGLIERIEKVLQRSLNLDSPRDHILASLIYSLGLWGVGVVVRKSMLSSLLSYMGWMYDAQRNPSLRTKVWMVFVFLLGGRNPKLYSYQGALPKLVLPDLKSTIDRFLKSMEPLLSEEEYAEIRMLAEEFRRKHGFKIQFYLYLKYLWSSNYVSDWWEEYVYLASRSPLMINSNYYATDCLMLHHAWLQPARAANVVCATVQFMQELNTEELQPLIIQGKIPLCSRQYERMFCTTRIPRYTESDPNRRSYRSDCLLHYPESRYIVVICRGNYYKVYFMRGDKYVDPVDMEKQFQYILDESEDSDDNSHKIAALTASDRNQWALNREKFFRMGINKESLDIIERAAFVLILEDESHDYDPEDDTKIDEMGKSLLHGKGYDRWFDKSFNIVVWKNGRIGFNAEHSWADAPVMAHYWEYMLLEDILSPKYGYNADGHCRGIPKVDFTKPQRLNWIVTTELSQQIDTIMAQSIKSMEDVDLHIYPFIDFGKGFMKTCKVSPDSYVQMALQLAYYRDMEEFALTYEASMTRLFREGRTETVRSCTNHSVAFVRGMLDDKLATAEKVRLLRQACDNHQNLYRDAMTGKGIDRHLFTMYVMSKYLKIDSEFLTKVMSIPWKLSTSQTPHSQNNRLDHSKYPNFLSGGGGFGPVAFNGYGVSYMMSGENTLFMHVSSIKSCPKTNSRRFVKEICKALYDIRHLFVPPVSAKGDK